MTFSANKLYIIVTWYQWSGIDGDTYKIYSDKEQAEKACSEINNQNTSSLILKKNQSSVMSLDDYIDEVKRNARSEALQESRDSRNFGDI